MLYRSAFRIPSLTLLGLFGLGACELPVSEVAATSEASKYTPDPTRPPVDEENEAPWDLPWDGDHNPYREYTDAFAVANHAKPVDVLFVMDNSASMAEEQAGVVDSFATFLEGFTEARVDYHIGVISTDTRTAANAWTSQAYRDFPNAGAGSLLAYAGNPRFISTALGRSEAIRQFRLNATLGIRGSGAEAGLQSVTAAFAPRHLASGGWNADFFRDDALLSVVLVSDEDESYGDTTSRYIKRNTADENTRIAGFIDTLRARKPGRPDLLRFDTVIAPSRAACPTVGADDGVLGTGDTYKKAHAQFYQGVTQNLGQVLNVCTDFSAALGALGTQIAVQVERRFQLTKAVEGELKVYLDGRALPPSETAGYVYVAATKSIEIRGSDLESRDDFQVRVEYIGRK